VLIEVIYELDQWRTSLENGGDSKDRGQIAGVRKLITQIDRARCQVSIGPPQPRKGR
jgi:hypothetical protein